MAGVVAVVGLLGMVTCGVSLGSGEPPGRHAAMTPSEEVTDDVEATGSAGSEEQAGGASDKYPEAPVCNAFSDEMLTRVGGDDPNAGDGEPTSPPNYGEGELSSCAWTGGEEWIVVQIRFFPATDDGAGTEAAKAEMESQNVEKDVSGIGEHALFTAEGPCRLLVR
ncbi:MAG: hypothetical protein ACRDTU_20600, partial [Micromonosporaceae bacterium]